MRLLIHHILQLVCESHLQFFLMRLRARAAPQRGDVAYVAAMLLATGTTPPFQRFHTRVEAILANDTSVRCDGAAGFADVVQAKDPAVVPIKTPPLIMADHPRRLNEIVEPVEELCRDTVLLA